MMLTSHISTSILVSLILIISCSSVSNIVGLVSSSQLSNSDRLIKPHLELVYKKFIGVGIKDLDSNLRPVSDGVLVYTVDSLGKIRATNLVSSKEVWSKDLPNISPEFSNNFLPPRTSGLTLSNGYLYLGSEKAQVYSINTQSGTIIWQSRVAGEILSPPVTSSNLVLVHTSNGMLQALGKDDGNIKWTINLDTTPLSIRGESSPVIAAHHTVIVGDDSSTVRAITTKEGHIIWQHQVSETRFNRVGDIDISPVIQKNVVYVATCSGHLLALKLHTGKLLWQKEIGSVSHFLVKNDRIYLFKTMGHLQALSTEDGITLWKQSRFFPTRLTNPVFIKSHLVVGDNKGYIYWIDVNNGLFIAQQKIHSSDFKANLSVIDTKLLVQTKKGELYVLSFDDNQLIKKKSLILMNDSN